MPSVALYTLGCKVSQYESEAIAERFSERGFRVVSSRSSADVYVINTCTVTAESDRKCRQVIRRLKGINPSAIVAVVGCYSQRAPSELADLGVDIIIGTNGKLAVVDRVTELIGDAALDSNREPKILVTPLEGAGFEPMCIKTAPRTRAYVKIEDGCEAKCSYCAISPARGPVRSKSREDVIAEVEALYKSDVREVVLTGIETGSYGRDFDTGYGLADLIVELNERKSAERLRLGSLAPELVGEEFARKVKGADILAPHFHLSMQSGSDRILAKMRRRYTSEMAYRNIEAIREAIPGAEFTTDLMVGFPGETEEDFLKTVEFVKRVGFIACHVFTYSRRDGTPAASYEGQIPEREKKERTRRLIAVAAEVRDGVLRSVVASAKELSVILETYRDGVYSGHSDEFYEVAVRAGAGMEGEYVRVKPISSSGGIIYAEMLWHYV